MIEIIIIHRCYCIKKLIVYLFKNIILTLYYINYIMTRITDKNDPKYMLALQFINQVQRIHLK